MQNGQRDHADCFDTFVTKEEFRLSEDRMETRILELREDHAGMSAAIKNLNITIKEVNITLTSLMDNKRVKDQLKLFSGKCWRVVSSIIGITALPLWVAHWTGLLKMIFHHLAS